MGRLFWKFFLSILLAQVAATIGIGGTIWLRDQSRQRGTEPTLDIGLPANVILDAAAVTLRHAGADGLRDLAATTRRPRLYVLDEQGHELLGRTVSAKLREEVERNLENGGPTHAVAQLTGPDGRRYLAFASRVPRTGIPLGAALEAGASAGAMAGAHAHGPGYGHGSGAPALADRRGPGPGAGAGGAPGSWRENAPGDAAPGTEGFDYERGPAVGAGNPVPAAGAHGAGAGNAPAGGADATRPPRFTQDAHPGGGPGSGPPDGDGLPFRPRFGPDARSGDGPGHGPDGGPLGFSPEFGRHVMPWLPLAAATLASLLFAALLAWYFTRPIRALRNAFELAAAGDLAPKFADRKPSLIGDELAELGPDFDRMTAQLRALMENQRRLLHDVSHELRSPLARLQAAIGLAHQQPERIGPSLERIEREGVRMDRLVGELLTLSRLEASTAPPQDELVDVVEMVDGVAEDARFEAGARIDVDAPTPLTVRGAPDLLWSAVENIVRNAVKHGGAHGKVDINLRADAGFVHIDVLDGGPGIDEEHLGEIFEPFFRSNPERNNVDGHGLGLAIAKRVVETHGGRIAAANRPEGGLRVTISLPRAA
jgi:two-component system OmpR family sensor kinase